MSERTLIDYMLKGMKGIWDWPVKHADPYTPGIADVSAFFPGAGNVFIECKAVDKVPSRSATIVRLKRYTDDQKMFLIRRRGFLFIRIAREYLLLFGPIPITEAGGVAMERLRELSCGRWQGSVNWEDFAQIIVLCDPNWRKM